MTSLLHVFLMTDTIKIIQSEIKHRLTKGNRVEIYLWEIQQLRTI